MKMNAGLFPRQARHGQGFGSLEPFPKSRLDRIVPGSGQDLQVTYLLIPGGYESVL